MEIKIDDLSGPQIPELLNAHLRDMALHSPPESVHALDLDSLRKPDISFWSAWEGSLLVGCGALKELDEFHAEIKSMKTAPGHLRKGIAQELLKHLIEVAMQRRYKRLSLETGSMAAFEPARQLYTKFQFDYCPPFADYSEDPYSVFMSKLL
ncbi:MAG: GNAT family N-acetyltransferase [Flavobacteriales bacterium]|nr:GNAT family N-acetyltransferase [Flavobacteriales bacterium]